MKKNIAREYPNRIRRCFVCRKGAPFNSPFEHVHYQDKDGTFHKLEVRYCEQCIEKYRGVARIPLDKVLYSQCEKQGCCGKWEQSMGAVIDSSKNVKSRNTKKGTKGRSRPWG